MIEQFNLVKLSNSLHFEYVSEIVTDLFEQVMETNGIDISNERENLKKALAVEDSAMKIVRGSTLTKAIAHADSIREHLYLGIQYAVQSALYHYDDAIHASAERINIVMKQYGNPVKMSYKAESGVLRSLIADFEAKLLPDMVNIGASHWVARLKEANLGVEKLIGSRSEEEISNAGPNMKDARLAVDAAYKQLVIRINAFAVINETPELTAFILRQNARINYYKSTLAQSGSRTKSADLKAK